MIKNLVIPNKKNNYSPFFSARLAMVILTLWVFLVNSFSGILIENFGVYATDLSADRIIELTNEERAKRDMQPVNANAYLTSAAHAKANHMFERQYWDHFGPDGESPWEFIKAAGYDYMYAGENLGKGFNTSEGVHQAWMASPTHKENILTDHYEDIGIAIVSGSLQNENIVLVVQMFGSLSRARSDSEAMIGEMQIIKGTSEDGKTKSIRITYPEDEKTYTDPQIPVRGDVKNFETGSIVEIIQENSVLGEATIQEEKAWEFQNQHDWNEGRNQIDAVITEGEEKFRDSVSFFISSAPPEILNINVKEQNANYTVSVEVDDLVDEVSLIMGAKIINGEIDDGVVEFSVSEDDLEDKIFLVFSNIHGNFGQKDITEYFFDEDERGVFSIGGVINFTISSLQRFITIALSIIVLMILFVQIYNYKKAEKLKERGGEFLMVGVWWFIFLFGSFIGYSGSIY